MDTHYLKLVYIAETAIAFNLAYIELKWKKQFGILTKRMNRLSSLSTVTIDRGKLDSVCNKKGCKKCDDLNHLGNKFSMFEMRYISILGNAMHSVPSVKFIDLLKSISQYRKLFKVWYHANGWFLKYLLCIFHIIAITSIDKFISYLCMGIATGCVVIMTMGDGHFDLFMILTKLDFWNYPSIFIWEKWLFRILLCSMLIPCLFWFSWRKFLIEYECLSYMLIEAYQSKSKGQIDVDNLFL